MDARDYEDAYLREEAEQQEPKCSDHPNAPHGFNRNASHNANRYVCDCEDWEPDLVADQQRRIAELTSALEKAREHLFVSEWNPAVDAAVATINEVLK